MSFKNSATHYGHASRVLHWTSVLLMLMSIMLGIELQSWPAGDDNHALVARHSSYGIALLAVMACRFGWRLSNQNPVLSYTLPSWHQRLAISLHWFIYALVVSQCVIGLVQVAITDQQLDLFGGAIVLDPGHHNAALAERLRDVHHRFAELLYITLGTHALAAIYHQVFGVVDPHHQAR